MPSCNTYRVTWVSLTLDVGYLFTAAPAKCSRCSLPYFLTVAPPDLECGIAPLGPPAPMQPLLRGRGVAPPGRRPWPRVWSSSSWPPPLRYRVLPASAPDLGRGVAPLGHTMCAIAAAHTTGKGQFSFQSQRKAMPKNAQTTAQLHSSHMLVK